MESKWNLPQSVMLGGIKHHIRTDFRVILDILKAMSDLELTDQEKSYVMLEIFYVAPEQIPEEYLEEALMKAKAFIDCGITADNKKNPRLMDWEQDSPIIAPAINKNIGMDIRSLKYLHWWTFIGAYMEIQEGLFSQVLYIRQKKIKGKKLEKWEQEFYRNNKHLIDLKTVKKERTDEEKDELRRLLGFKK